MISDILKQIFDNGIVPALLAAASVQFPPLGVVLGWPIIGPFIRKVVNWGVNWLIDKGVIEIKVQMIDALSAEARAKYAPEIQLLRDAQAKPNLTPEEEDEFAKRLQNIVKNRPDVVNA